MRLLLDENLPRRLCDLCREVSEFHHVSEFDLLQTDDRQIWDFAREHGFAVVTRDRDFFERALLIGPPPQVIWLRLGNASTIQFAKLLLDSQAAIEEFRNEEAAAFLVLPPGLQI